MCNMLYKRAFYPTGFYYSLIGRIELLIHCQCPDIKIGKDDQQNQNTSTSRKNGNQTVPVDFGTQLQLLHL